ncbi:MAG: sialate O-acetylesterase [Clostridiales bacterium]|nr:sialate O-acetylesterase [Clostridiales bacterium]
MRLSDIFSDGMIFQRDKRLQIYGEAREGTKVQASLSGHTASAIADHRERFLLTLPAVPAGGPYEIAVKADDGTQAILTDVYAGDVFLLAGQSNMELPVNRTLDLYREEVEASNYPLIRMFQLPKEPLFTEKRDILTQGEWICACYPELLGFSALGYFFAVQKYQHDGVAVGLVHAAVGGTHIEAFISEETLLKEMVALRIQGIGRGERPGCSCGKNDSCKYCYEEKIARNKDENYVNRTQRQDELRAQKWYDTLAKHDIGIARNWIQADWNQTDADIMKIQVPGLWKNHILGNMNGSVWLKKVVNVPEEYVGHETELRLGTIVDGDQTYMNGTLVGCTEYQYPPRRYRIPAGVLKAGDNTITIRVIVDGNLAGDAGNIQAGILPDGYSHTGGFRKDMPYCIKDGEREISLEGIWDARIGTAEMPLEGATFFAWQPTALYNSMIYGVRYYRFCAILYYQGESNCGHAEDYAELHKIMIQEWRRLFGEELPYLYAQLPDFAGEEGAGCDDWIRLQRAQKEALKLENTQMVVLHDLGQYNELHPQNKKEVAQRFYEKWREMEQ